MKSAAHTVTVNGKPVEITTSVDYPPIPTRKFDWCAYESGQEEYGRYGYGATEQDAIADLIDLLDE